MSQDFRLLMIGAMYENGGNTSHRFLDGHPQLFVYPFESQPGTKYVNDYLSSMYPLKYRWPTFPLEATPQQDYKAIIDEECKVRTRTPHVSKFRDKPFDLSDDHRMELYLRHIEKTGRSRASNMAAFFKATFEAWKDRKSSGREEYYVGYSPIITVDANKILDDFPQAHFLHVVRNPWSAYADTKKRPVPLSLHHYMLGWTQNQHFALIYKEKYPDRMHIVRTEDVMANPRAALGQVCERMGLEAADTLQHPTWNGELLTEIYPWGTIKQASTEANLATARELSVDEQLEIKLLAGPYLKSFDYENILSGDLARR